MGTYGQGRDKEFLDKFDGPISDFIPRYNANPSTTNGHTIILFPGGMGSHLLRASTKYQNGPPFFYNTVWLDCSIASGVATDLQMHRDEDYHQHYVIADGCIDFVNLRPYEGFIQWCQSNWLDLFVFGWDWRRGIENTVDFFLGNLSP